jgi:hypothetical protein
MPTQTYSAADIARLHQTVAGLAEALAHSERRHAQLGRMVRWATLSLIAVLAFAGFSLAERMGMAHAQDPNAPARSELEALNNINQNLMVLGEMGRTLNMLVPAVEQAMMGNEDVQAYVAGYVQDRIEETGVEPTPEQQQRFAVQAIVSSVVGTTVDAVVLMNRLREDSDAFRAYVEGPEKVLRDLHKDLVTMNIALASIPAMAAQMDLMNRNMATMSYSMGSTMGRMGKWMPF